jgi:predicted NBD/HSP70 family sugar kinase
VRGRIGQPSVPLALNPDGAFSIGVKIGRRSTEWLLVDFTGAVRARRSMHYAAPDAQTLLPALREHLDALRHSLGDLAPRLLGVGVAAPFQLGGWHKMLGLSEAQSGRWNELDLATEVQHLTDLPVSFAKDTSAACVAELISGRGHDLKTFLYLFVDTFVGGGLVINSHLHTGVHGNAGAVASVPLSVAEGQQVPEKMPERTPEQLLKRASLWDLEQRYSAIGQDPTAAYDDRALQAPFNTETQIWLGSAALGLAHCIVSGTAFLDLDAVVIDASCCRELLQQLIAQTQQALTHYSWEGLWPVKIVQGKVGPDAGALGGALLPLHAHFAPNHGLFLK